MQQQSDRKTVVYDKLGSKGKVALPTSALNWGQWSSTRPNRFTPR